MKNVYFFKKTVIISIFFSFFLITSSLSGKVTKSNGSIGSNNLTGVCVDLTRGSGVVQVLQQVLILQEQFQVLLEESLDKQGDATADLESIIEDLNSVAEILGVRCP